MDGRCLGDVDTVPYQASQNRGAFGVAGDMWAMFFPPPSTPASIGPYDFLLLAKPPLAGAPAIVHIIEPVLIQCGDGATQLPPGRTALNYQLVPPVGGTYVFRTCGLAVNTSLIVRVRDTAAGCVDDDSATAWLAYHSCQFLSSNGFCASHRDNAEHRCPLSCNVCATGDSADADLQAATVSYQAVNSTVSSASCPSNEGMQITLVLSRISGIVIDVLVVPETPTSAPDTLLTASLQCPALLPPVCSTGVSSVGHAAGFMTAPLTWLSANFTRARFLLNLTETGIYTVSTECHPTLSFLGVADSPTLVQRETLSYDRHSRSSMATFYGEAGTTFLMDAIAQEAGEMVLRVQPPTLVTGCQIDPILNSSWAAPARYVASAAGMYTVTACVPTDVDITLRAGFERQPGATSCRLLARLNLTELDVRGLGGNPGSNAPDVGTRARCQSLCTAKRLCRGFYWDPTSSRCTTLQAAVDDPEGGPAFLVVPGDCYTLLAAVSYLDADNAVMGGVRACERQDRQVLQITARLAAGEVMDVLVAPAVGNANLNSARPTDLITVEIECPRCAASAGPGLVTDHSVWDAVPGSNQPGCDQVSTRSTRSCTAKCRHPEHPGTAANEGTFTCTAGRWVGQLMCHNNVSEDGQRVPGDCNETIYGERDAGYRGCQSQSVSGNRCQMWDSRSPRDHPFADVDDFAAYGLGSHNFCRNPVLPDGTGGEATIWCYTHEDSPRGLRWERCAPVSETTESRLLVGTLLQDGVYYRPLPLHFGGIHSLTGLAGALQLSASATYGPLSGRLAAPTSQRENSAVARALREIASVPTLLQTPQFQVNRTYIAVRNANERISGRHRLDDLPTPPPAGGCASVSGIFIAARSRGQATCPTGTSTPSCDYIQSNAQAICDMEGMAQWRIVSGPNCRLNWRQDGVCIFSPNVGLNEIIFCCALGPSPVSGPAFGVQRIPRPPGFPPEQSEVYLHVDVPLWTMVTGRERGVAVWNGTCSTCTCSAPTSPGALVGNVGNCNSNNRCVCKHHACSGRSCTTSYRLVTSGVCTDPIRTLAECSEAAAALMLPDVTATDDGQYTQFGSNFWQRARDPPGCYYDFFSAALSNHTNALKFNDVSMSFCGDVPAAGNAMNGAYTNWLRPEHTSASAQPKADLGCVGVDMDGLWQTLPCAGLPTMSVATVVQFELVTDIDSASLTVCEMCDCLKPFEAYDQLPAYDQLQAAHQQASSDLGLRFNFQNTSYFYYRSIVNAKVDCSATGLIEIPPLHELEQVYAAYTPLPRGSSVGPQLTLDLSYNRIASFGAPFAVNSLNSTANLWKLDLSSNQLTGLPFLQHGSLVVLDLSSNPITMLYNGAFNLLPRLELLALNNLDRLVAIPPGVFDRGNLGPRANHVEYVEMHASAVMSFPASLSARYESSRGFNFTCGLQAGREYAGGRPTFRLSGADGDRVSCLPRTVAPTASDPTATTTTEDRLDSAPNAADPGDGSTVGLAAGGVFFVVLVAGVVLFTRTRREKLRTQKHHVMMTEMVDKATSIARNHFLSKSRHIMEREGRADVSESVAAFDASFGKLRLNLKDFVIESASVGEGTFGRIYPATVRGKQALAKCANTNVRAKLSECLAEAMRIHLLRHENIVGLLGVVDDRIPMMYAVEYMTGGSLKQYLRRHRPGAAEPSSLPISDADLLVVSSKVAAGCAFLERKCVVHRNLAADAVMVSEDGTQVKLANLGEARDIYETAVYVANNRFTSLKRLAVRWMAPETIKDDIFSIKSDVWSFGVVCFEIFSFGKAPYGALSASEIAGEILGGRRLEPPAMCSDRLCSLVRSTWATDPLQRPSFAQIYESLKLQTMPDALKVFELQARSRAPPTDTLAIIPSRQLKVAQQLPSPTDGSHRYVVNWTTSQQQPPTRVIALSAGSTDGSLLTADLQAMLRVRSCDQVLAPQGRGHINGLGAAIMLGSSALLSDKVLSDIELPTALSRRRAAIDVAAAIEFIAGQGMVVRALHPGLCHVTAANSIKLLVVGAATSVRAQPQAGAGEAQRWDAPETRADGTVTAASNVFSLSTLVWAISSVPHPWTAAVAGPSAATMFPEPLDYRGVPGLLATALQSCRQRDPVARPVASEVINALRDGWEIDPARLTSLRVLGAGEFGEVTLQLLAAVAACDDGGGVDAGDRALVAVKALRQDDGDAADEPSVQKFLAELNLMKDLRHPHIVQLIGAVTESLPQMIVLEFLAGGALDEWLEANRGRGLAAAQLNRTLHQIALGMGALTGAGIVHRDLAARNVLVGEGLLVKIADFGLSRTFAAEKEYYQFREGGMISLRWTAPECITRLKWTSASDVYSFGVLISEVCVGEFPFDSLSDTAVVEFITAGEDPIDSKLPFSLEGGPSNPTAESAATACLFRDPARRPTFEWLANAFLPAAASIADVSLNDLAETVKMPPAGTGEGTNHSSGSEDPHSKTFADKEPRGNTYVDSYAASGHTPQEATQGSTTTAVEGDGLQGDTDVANDELGVGVAETGYIDVIGDEHGTDETTL